MDAPPHRPVKRTYGKPKPVLPSAADDVPILPRKPDTTDTSEDDATRSHAAVSEGTPEDASSSPRDEDDSAREESAWEGLKRGKGADWRRIVQDEEESEEEDPADELADGGAYERAKRAVMARQGVQGPTEQVSSSLPPLTSEVTSEDPLAMDHEEEQGSPVSREEEETMPVKPRRRVIKDTSTDASSSSSEEHIAASTPPRRRARSPPSTTPRRATEDTQVALPSSQPEYQRLMDRAQEKQERKRAQREARAAAEREDAAEEGLQTSPMSPTVRRAPGEARRRRKVVADSDEKDADRETTTPARANRAGDARTKVRPSEVWGSGGESDDEDDDGGFKKTMGKMLERPLSPVRDAEPTVEEPEGTSQGDGEGKARRRVRRPSGSGSSDSERAGRTRKGKLKSLSKKEKDQMHKEAAQIRAAKEVHIARVSKRFSVAGFVTDSVTALSAKIPFRPISQQVSAVPTLVPSRVEAPTQSSAVVPTPDSEIGQYSSQQRPVEVHEQQDDATPTKGPPVVQKTTRLAKPGAPLVVGLDDSGSESDEDGLKAVLKLKAGDERARDEEKQRLAFKDKQRMLKARKEAAVKAQMDAERAMRPAGAPPTLGQSGKADGKTAFLKGVSRLRQDLEIDMDDSDADDDLEILDTPAVKPVVRKTGQRLNPKDMLDVKREQGAGKSRGGGRLQFGPKKELTDSMYQHAGHTFDQAGKRQREGTATKAGGTGGAGSNKLAPISIQESHAYLWERQRKMAALERQKKERESGLKSRALQPRREQLIDEEILEEARKAEERRLAMGDAEENAPGDDDDDSDDGDFEPEGDGADDDAEADVEMEDRVLVEETQDAEPSAPKDIEMADDRTPEAENPSTGPKTPTPVDSLEETEEALRQRKRKRQAVLDSDEEEESARTVPRISPTTKRVASSSEGVPESSLVSRKVDEPSAPAPLSFGGGFDDFAGGFGDAGGLSQFFGATQAPGATGSATQNNGAGKGLDALRQGTPAAGHLAFGNLGAVVSATAQERNLALFAADITPDAHSGYTPKPPQRQYLNSQGLFTQTTPKLNGLQGQESMNLDDESMPLQRDSAISSEHEDSLLEPTYRSNHASSLQDDLEQLEETSTPRASLSRLKRRREEGDEAEPPSPPDVAEAIMPVRNMDVDAEDEEVAMPSSQPEPSPRSRPQLDAMQTLMAAARRPPSDRIRANPALLKAYLDGEAELDLEDDNGFFNRLDDENDDAEGDGVVENLVDDAERTKEQELEDARRRAEIDREYDEQEDARRQKIAQDVIEGKFKGKRRDGLDGVLSSDDEDDEDKRKAKRRWRQLQKRRELGKDLAELAQGETQAFVQAYQGGLESDHSDDEVEPSQDQPVPQDEDAEDDDEAEDVPTIRNKRPIGIREIEDQVRLLAQQNRDREQAKQNVPIEIDGMPPAAYVDSDTDQEDSQITISRRRNEQPSFRKESNGDLVKYERWANAPDNNDSRRAGARSAVTGGILSSRSLGRNDTSNKSGSFASIADVGKKNDKAVRPRASAMMGGVLAKKSGFADES